MSHFRAIPSSAVPYRSLGAALLIAAHVVMVTACGSSNASARTQSAGPQEVSDCDTYAAHPDDLNRWAQGVSDGAIVPGLAVQRCSAAVSRSSKTGRFQFQLGRALLANARPKEAREAFATADQLGYCPAKFYLGEAALQDSDEGNDQRFGEAVKLYEAAEQCGFAPATERLNELAFSAEGFEAPRLIQALYEGDIEKLNKTRLPVALYLQGFHEYMAMDFHPVSQSCPALVARAAVVYDLEAAVNGDSRLGAVSSAVISSILSVSPAAVGAFVDPVYFGDIEKFKGYFRALGKRDAIHLIETFGGADHGCTSEVTGHLYRELIEFAKAKKPLQEYMGELLPNMLQLFGPMGIRGEEQESTEAPAQ